MHATPSYERDVFPWTTISLGIGVLALLASGVTLGLSMSLGFLGFLFVLPALRTGERYRAITWVALIFNGFLAGYFIWVLQFYEWS